MPKKTYKQSFFVNRSSKTLTHTETNVLNPAIYPAKPKTSHCSAVKGG